MRPAAICLRGALVHDKVYWFASPEEDKLMLKRLLSCLISLSSTQACADIFLARCRVVDRHGVGLLAFRPHYPVRHWSRIGLIRICWLICGTTISHRRSALMGVPHYPWTLSETIIDQGTLQMSGDTVATGVLSIDHGRPGARILCQERKET